MGTITLEGVEPFDLRLQLPIEVTAQDETVALTFPVFAAGLPQSIGRIQLPLFLGDAAVFGGPDSVGRETCSAAETWVVAITIS